MILENYKREEYNISDEIKGSEILYLQNISYIEELAFAYNDSIRIIVLPDVTRIARKGFYKMPLLERVIMPNLQYVDEAAFEGCTNLKKIDFLDNVIIIEENAFEGCTNLKNEKLKNTFKTAIGGDCVFDFEDDTDHIMTIQNKIIKDKTLVKLGIYEPPLDPRDLDFME